MKIGKLLAVLTLSLLLLPAVPVTAAPTVSDIGKELICQCGCYMILTNCTHSECASRSSMTSYIGERLDQGDSKDQIIASFVAAYGEKVLASPPKKGFNLVAWLLPFAAIVAGGVVISLALRSWVGRGSRYRTESADSLPQADEEAYQQRIEKELDEFPEGGFR